MNPENRDIFMKPTKHNVKIIDFRSSDSSLFKYFQICFKKDYTPTYFFKKKRQFGKTHRF